MDDRQIPFNQYEYVDVTFPPTAGEDQVVRYEKLRPESFGDVRWIDVCPNGAFVSKGSKAWGPQYVVLKASSANYATRLLLFIERR